MKKASFKFKTTVWITLLVTLICAVTIGGILVMSRRVAGSEIRQSLIRTVERNADEIEYKNGILEIEKDFVFYSDGVYCDVYGENSELISGNSPAIGAEKPFANGETSRLSGENGEYYVYDTFLSFNKYEYEIDVFTGQIIKYEADVCASEDISESGYTVTSFYGGIDTEEAIAIALNHAGTDRENAKIVSAEIPGYENRQVFKIEFVCTNPLYSGIWIRGSVAASAAESTFGAINKAIIYIIPLFIAFAALGAYLISKRTISPVEKITASAKEINSGSDLTKRIETDGGSDEIATLAETFNEMLERLQISFENEKQFTSDASHELRTPLAVIKAECEFALSDKSDEEDKQEALVSVSEQADKMTALVSALLTLTRTEKGMERFNFEEADLSLLTDEVCRSFKTQKGITLESDIEENILLNMDVSLITRLLENLLSNAVRYGKENGKIRVALKKCGLETVLCVEDDGIGIKEDVLPKIWGRFYRADPSRSGGEGFGIGLALVKKIAELHGGTVRAESEYGKGSKFIVTFLKKV